jgi:hypothetical protein
MDDKEETVKINCILRDEVAKKFAKIKRATGLQQNTEVIRVVINAYSVQEA